MRMLNIDKSNWRKVSLLDVVYKTENNDKLNAKNLFKKFIKAEHLDAESLNIKSFGDQDKDELPPTFYKIFKANQILYPTRNPHLRRAALAHFDGICGEKTLTLSVNEDVADYRFIAFLFHSNSFYTHTTNCIVGSTNPHVRWRDVANYEFLLPPKVEQAELADLLWAMDNVIEKDLEVLERLEDLFKSFERKYFIDEVKNRKAVLLSEVAEISGGATPLTINPKLWNGHIPWLTPTDITNYKGIYFSKPKDYITKEGLQSISNRLYPVNSILFCSRASIGEAIINEVPMATNQGFTNLICHENIIVKYLYFYLKSQAHNLKKIASGTTFLEISKQAFRNFKIHPHDKNEQLEISNKLEDLFNLSLKLESKLQSSKALQKALINQVF